MQMIAYTLVAQPRQMGATLEDARAFLVPKGMDRDQAIYTAVALMHREELKDASADRVSVLPTDFTWAMLAPPEFLR